jgi:mannose-6-phosphate isomerase-like protein (cupin superfamily)
MSGYSVARLDEIDEIDDGRVPWRPVRHHLGMTSFGMNAFTAPNAGDRLINEHDESHDESEEVYLVTQGRARFELDGEHLDAPAGTFVYVKPEVTRTAFAEEPGTTLLAVGGVPEGVRAVRLGVLGAAQQVVRGR